MEIARPTRAEISAPKNQNFNKKQFVQYEPAMVEEFNQKKSGKVSVSGRLLTLIYKRLSFWSRYSKHQHNGRRYFWKSIPELSEEISYSEKSVARGLKVLVELGLIIREKLNKRNWKHVYYYYLPKSPHTAEPAVSEGGGSSSRRPTSSRRNSRSSCDAPDAPRTVSGVVTAHSSRSSSSDPLQGVVSGVPGTSAVPPGTGGSVHPSNSGAAPSAGSVRSNRRFASGQFGSVKNNRRTPLLENQLRSIVEKCLDYGERGIKTINEKGGIGFAT